MSSGPHHKQYERPGRRGVLLGLFVLAATPEVARAQSWWDRAGDALDLFGDDNASELSEAKIGRALKDALRVASREVVARVGQAGGYLDDPAIHIPLPTYLETARDTLEIFGAARLLSNLEQQLNRAAETAAPAARSIFFDAIGEMTVADARQILNGPKDAATRYFERTMSPDLRNAFRPIIDARLNQTGAIQTLEQTVEEYESIPFASSLAADAQKRLVDHGLAGALDGLFHYMAKEEAAIRDNPAKRTTDLLKDVFG